MNRTRHYRMSTRAAGGRGNARADPGRGKRGIHAWLVRRRDAARHRGGRRSCAPDAGESLRRQGDTLRGRGRADWAIDLEHALDGGGRRLGRGRSNSRRRLRAGRATSSSARSPSRSESRPSRRRSSWVAAATRNGSSTSSRRRCRACAERRANGGSPSSWPRPTSTPGSCFAATRVSAATRRSPRSASSSRHCTTKLEEAPNERPVDDHLGRRGRRLRR